MTFQTTLKTLITPQVVIFLLVSVTVTVVAKGYISQLSEFSSVLRSPHRLSPVKNRRAFDPDHVPQELYDEKHGIKMGIPIDGCDDAVHGLQVDWDGNPINYTCFNPRKPIIPRPSEPLMKCADIPEGYSPKHFCMKDEIRYKDKVPTHGDHRPLWPKFGEYQFVPPQRWLHNIEHGSVVMLYHPCTHHAEVDKLRRLVTGCIRKHVITPYAELPPDRPLSLVAWGCHLSMSGVDPDTVIDFIRAKGLKGPEGEYAKEGQYTYALVEQARAPNGSDLNDRVLCPGF